jgi:thioredoxin 1
MVKTLEDLKSLLESEKRLVVIDFFAEWCGPCKRISPEIHKLEQQYNQKIVVLTVDVDKCEDISSEYKIECMPTILFIKNGKIVETVTGANIPAVHANIKKHGN